LKEKMNIAAADLLMRVAKPRQAELRIRCCDDLVFDFGVNVRGGIQAGLLLSRICMADMAEVKLIPGQGNGPHLIQVTTDQPALACMGSQYGGWPVSSDDFFAIGSGPIRLLRGKEKVLQQYEWSTDQQNIGVLILESARIPDGKLLQKIADEAGVSPENLLVCVAPTKSMAGSIQIVARSVESTMHKLFELKVDLNLVTSGHGTAPLPLVSADDLTAIGRTNDSIMYCGKVTLWADMPDDQIKDLGPQVPSNSSSEFGKSFKELFEACDGDFYKMDPMLFSAAEVTFVSNLSGNSFRFGELRPGMVAR